MVALEPRDWLEHSLAEPLLRWNLLPTSWMHPSRRAEWAQHHEPALSQAVVHRHESAALLEALGLGVVRDLDDPALPLCLADQALFDRLSLTSGAAVLWAALRRVIVRAELAALYRELGEDCLVLVRRLGCAGLVADVEPAPTLSPDVRQQALGAGQALVAVALQSSQRDVAERGLLRLPLQASSDAELLPVALRDPAKALLFVRIVLQELDAPWLSSFPAHP